MTIARWAIPFLLVAVTGCATAPTPVEPTKAVAGPQKPAVEAPKKAAAKPAAPKKTETAKVDPKKAPPKLETKQSDTAKLPPKPVTPKPVTVAAVPATPAGLPPSVFTDASALAPVPGDQSIVITDSAAISTDSLVDNAPTSTVPTPTYTMASLTEPAIVDPLLSQPAPRILPQAAVPQSVAPQPVVSSGAMAFLTKLEQSGSAPDGPYGYIILDAESGQTLNEGNADTPLAPASIAKLLAAVAILDTKGPNSTFRTSLLADGAVSGGVLNGDLHLVGSGDPSLNRSDLSGLAQRLASAGVRQVSGKFYYHGDALPEVAMIDRGQPAGAIYNTGISGLNLDHNEHRGASPVKDPAKYTADGMRRAAESAGVSLPSPTKGRGQANGTEIASHDSAPVSVILTEMFDISRNMTAEVLGAVAASEIAGKPSTLREAASTNAQWAQSTIGSIGGLEWVGFNFPNNSGLTTSARATPRQMAALVRHGYLRHGEQFKRIYEEQSTGSSAGVDFAIRAKIGTMSYVRGLGGIISVGGRDMAFAIMAMDPARSTRNAKAWMGKARRLEQALMSDWLKNFWPSAQQVASR